MTFWELEKNEADSRKARFANLKRNIEKMHADREARREYEILHEVYELNEKKIVSWFCLLVGYEDYKSINTEYGFAFVNVDGEKKRYEYFNFTICMAAVFRKFRFLLDDFGRWNITENGKIAPIRDAFLESGIDESIEKIEAYRRAQRAEFKSKH